MSSKTGRTHGDSPSTDTAVSGSDGTVVAGILAYNEGTIIGSIVLQSRRYADEVIVVDDGSSDDTVTVAEKSGGTVIEHAENKGKGQAVRTLFGYVQDIDLDAFVLLDGDGQHLPSDIPSVAAPVVEGRSDLAIGSRYLTNRNTETPAYRQVGQRVPDLLTLGSSGRNFADTQSGFRALSPHAVSKLNVRTDGMGVESEMIASAVEKELDAEEVSIDARYEGVDGQTHHPLRHGLMMAAFVIQLIRDRHPLAFFGLPGVSLLLLGGIGMTSTAHLQQSTGAFYPWRALASWVVVLVGTIALFCGIVSSQIQSMLQTNNG